MKRVLKEKVWNSFSFGFRTFSKLKKNLLLLFLVGTGIFYWYANQLVVSITPDGGQKQRDFKTNIGDVWYIEFIHSVQKTPVQEYFLVRGSDDLLLKQTRYQSLGVGLPYMSSEGKLQTTGDGYFVLDMNREYKSIKLRTGLEACPRIYSHGDIIPIYNLYEPGTLVEIKVVKRYNTWFAD